MFIPFVNVLNMFICIYNLHAIPIERKNELKMVAYLLGYSMPIAIGYSFLYRFASGKLPLIEPLLYVLGIYLIPMIMSYGLIRFQEKYVFTKAQ